jgi:hypothetical protein
MKVDVDFEDALKAFCEENRKSYCCKPTTSEVAGWITLLLETLKDYETVAASLNEAIARESINVQEAVKERLIAKAEEND